MKNNFLRTIGTAALAIFMFAAFAHNSASAQDNDGGYKGARGLEGVWNVQVTRIDCTTGAVLFTASSILTYAQGGTMSESGSAVAPSRRGPGQGVWSHQSGRTFVTAFEFFRFNADGSLAGRQISRATVELSPDGNTTTNVGFGQTLDVNGNVIATACNNATSTRFE